MITVRKLLTADDLLAMPRDGSRHELVRGELITMPPPGIKHAVVTGRIGRRIGNYAEELGLAFIDGPDAAAYIEENPDTIRAADYALLPYQRGVASLPDRGYIPGLIPALVVEVISPDYGPARAAERVQMWLDAGVRLVVVAHIAARTIVTHSDDGAVRSFTECDTLTLDPVLPGFACPVSEIYAY